MNLGDKLATVLFMLAAAMMVAAVGYFAVALVWRDLATGTVTRSTWLLLGCGLFAALAMALGVRQCVRALRAKVGSEAERG